MDDKTEELRDIFMDVTDSDTVTETQEETHGSLTEQGGVAERLEATIVAMREEYDFETDLGLEALCGLVRSFYDGEGDAEIGRELEVSRDAVFRARMDLHLVRDRDREAPFELGALRERLEGGDSMSDVAAEFDVSTSTVRRYRRVVEATDEARRANDRYRDEFETILADADLSGRLTDDVQEDGLEDATDGMETDVSF